MGREPSEQIKIVLIGEPAETLADWRTLSMKP